MMATLRVPAACAVDKTAGSAPPSARVRAVAVKVVRKNCMVAPGTGTRITPRKKGGCCYAARAT
ncbi:hypothetical protein D3C72_2279910 [compost metagenome]